MAIEEIKRTRKDGKTTRRYRAVVRNRLNMEKTRISKTFQRKIDAVRWAAAQDLKMERGLDISRSRQRLSIGEAIALWFSEHVTVATSAAYANRVSATCATHIEPFFGATDLKKIESSHILEFRKYLINKKLSNRSVNSIIKTLKALLNHHYEEERIHRVPIRKKHMLHVKTKIQSVWPVEQCAAFLQHAKDKYLFKDRHVYVLYLLAAATGMRFGEIIALEIEDLDFDYHRIRVSKSYCRYLKGPKSPKNGRTRFVPMTPTLEEALQDYIRHSRIQTLLFPAPRYHEPMASLRRSSGQKPRQAQYLTYNTFRNCHYLKDVKAAGVPYAKFHNLRRFYATEFLRNGGNEAILRKVMGHAHVTMTDHYHALGDDYAAIAKYVQVGK